MLEELIAKSLNIKTRKDYRENNFGNLREIEYNNNCDKAFIRVVFKRHITRFKPKAIRMVNNNMEGGYLSLEGGKTWQYALESISNWILYEMNNGKYPYRLEFEYK